MSESSEWVAWVGPARQGDADSIEKLSTYFFPFVHAVLVSRVSRKTAALHVRPVISGVIARLANLSSDAGFASWVLVAAREKAFEAAKAPGAAVDVPGRDAMVNSGHAVLARLRMLSESSRERLAMRLLEGVQGEEIAEVVGGKPADVRTELERAAATLVQQLTGKSVSFAGDSYLWSLVGTPHPALIPLETQLTPLRFDSLAEAELSVVAAPKGPPEGRRITGAGSMKAVKSESTEPSGLGLKVDDEEDTAANPVPRPSQTGLRASGLRAGLKAPAVATDPSNPFGTSVKTIHASDLPAAADFADLKALPNEVVPVGADEDFDDPSTQVQPVSELTREAPKAEEPPTRPSGSRSRKTLAPLSEATEALSRHSGSKAKLKHLAEPVDHDDVDMPTAIRGNVVGSWRAANVVGNPAPIQKTVMGLPAIVVKSGSVTRSWRPFAIAAAFGLLALGVALLLFDGSKKRVRSGWALVPVVVAATDLTEGTVITIEMISQRSVPEAFITSSVIRPDSLSYVVNQKILVDAQAGDPLLWSQFEVARANERLSKKVMRRARAFDMMTSKTIAVGGWVQPNDRIDIIASLKGNANGERVAITLLQDVPVLSTGKITSSTPSAAIKDGDKDYIDLSVLLLPEETELIALAIEVGDLQFTLRTEEDHDVVTDHRGSNFSTILSGERQKLLQLKRMKTIQQIRSSRNPAP